VYRAGVDAGAGVTDGTLDVGGWALEQADIASTAMSV
jgi:hypothetical protein